MRAEPSAQLRLLDLQDLDTKLAQLAHRRRGVPHIAELAALEGKSAAVRDREVAVRTQVADLEQELAKAEADVTQVRERITRDRSLLETGAVSSARQLSDLQHEVDSLTRRVSDLEDAELEVMETLEQTQARLHDVVRDRDELSRAREAAQVARDAAFAEVDAEVARVATERARVVAEVPGDLVTLYERIRADQGGVGAAALYRGRCQGCQLTLTPADLGRIRGEAADEVVRCEECRRIIVRTPESGL